MMSAPLRVLTRLVQTVSSRDAATAAVGDILEDLRQRREAGRGPRWETLWIVLQIASASLAFVLAAVPRTTLAGWLTLRDAARSLRSTRAQSLFVVLVLAIGITAGTVTFSVVDAVLLKPLPLKDPDQLVLISARDAARRQRTTGEIYWRLHREMRTVEGLGMRGSLAGGYYTIGGVATAGNVSFTTRDVLDLVRWTPALGRFWTTEEEAANTRVAVVGHRLWRERFHSSDAVLNDTVTVDKVPHRIIGVLPAEADSPDLEITTTQVWIPQAVPRTGRVNPHAMFARMRPGVTPAEVAEEVQRLSGLADWTPTVTPLFQGYVATVSRWMWMALGAAAAVVLIACVNAANLMLTRAGRRSQELAVRASLGASRRRLAGVVLIEGLLLSLAATAAALLLSIGAVRGARIAMTTMVFGVFRAESIALNGRVLFAAAVTALLTGVVVALVPAWQTARASLTSLLKDAEGPATIGRRRWRSVFLVTEVAVVAVLLVGSWLFVMSLIRVTTVDLGLDRAGLVAVKPRLPFKGTVVDVQKRVAAVPGVSGVAVSMGASLPLFGSAFSGAWWETGIRLPEAAPDRATKALDYRVSHNYFEVAGMSFVRGGTWSPESAVSSPSVVLDERLARALFGQDDPIGRILRRTEPDAAVRVTGVVPFVPVRGPEEDVLPAAYFSQVLAANRIFAGLLVRTSRPPADTVRTLNEVLAPYAPSQPEPYVHSADEAMSRLTARRRFNAALMSAFGAVGLLIGIAGIYAVMVSFVTQQTREIGVRLALGATPARVQHGILRLAWGHVAVGLMMGLPVAWWVSRGFSALLFQVTPADVSVYAGVSVLTGIAATLAAWLPARRASSIDPIVSLRR